MRRKIEKGEAAVEAASDQNADVLAEMSEQEARYERETYLQDAITNIHHYADHYGLDWQNALIREEIREDAERIDPRTAEMVWSYEQLADPYGLEEEISPEAYCMGRMYFLVDRARGTMAVLVSDVRAAHPEIPDEEWDELMRAAAKRDTSPDPFPLFHRWKEGPGHPVLDKLRQFASDKRRLRESGNSPSESDGRERDPG